MQRSSIGGMNRRDLVLVASRLIALYLLIPALLDLLTLPLTFFWIHDIGAVGIGGEITHALRRAIPGELVTDVAKVAIGWAFWKCGPNVERLFSE